MVVSAAWLEKASGSSLFLWIEMISMRLSDSGGEKKKFAYMMLLNLL